MDLRLPEPPFMPCPACGASIARASDDEHVCDEARVVDFTVVQLRPELESLEDEFAEFLDTPQGRFEAWLAKRDRAA